MLNFKTLLARPLASKAHKAVRRSSLRAIEDQKAILRYLRSRGQITDFGKDHRFDQFNSYHEFKEAVPIRDYEGLKKYISSIQEGRNSVLWPGRPLYLAKTSGTTSGAKYIPISKESIHNHIDTARNCLLLYLKESGNYSFVSKRMIFLSGSPVLEEVAGIQTGRLSGIVNHHVPAYLKKNQLPAYETNCIDEWEEKLERIVNETIEKDMGLISGIPPWVQMYFDRLQERSGKSIKELFPNFSVLVHGGVNVKPYETKLYDSIGGHVDMIETFPASEGFFAFQDTLEEEGLLLNTNSGIFFEFVPAGEIFDDNPTRLSLEEVELNVNYALIINSNAGLWGYNIGDTVKFVSKDPYRIVVSGRIKHFISAFGEHVIAEEVEYALTQAIERQNAQVVEFTVAPNISKGEGQSYHEWFISFSKEPKDLEQFALDLDTALRKKNIYYEDLVGGKILKPLVITKLKEDAFQQYMKSIGKLGGQNKVPRLSNDRKIADALQDFKYG